MSVEISELETFKNDVAKGDIHIIRSRLCFLLTRITANDSIFDEALAYAQEQVPDLMHPHNGEEFTNESVWDKDYLDKQYKELRENFSKERIDIIKKIERALKKNDLSDETDKVYGKKKPPISTPPQKPSPSPPSTGHQGSGSGQNGLSNNACLIGIALCVVALIVCAGMYIVFEYAASNRENIGLVKQDSSIQQEIPGISNTTSTSHGASNDVIAIPSNRALDTETKSSDS